MQTRLIIFLLEKNHCQLSEFVSSKKWYIRLPTLPRHKHFLLEGNRHKFAPFSSSTKMTCRVFSHISTPTWCIIFLLEKNRCQCSQFFSSKKMIHQVICNPLMQTSGLTRAQAQNGGDWWRVTPSTKCKCQEMTFNLMYHFFTCKELRWMSGIRY